MRLGAHVGIAEGFRVAVSSAVEIGCESIQIFSKSPQMWAGSPLLDDSAVEFRGAVQESGLRPNAVHHGYLVNLASPKRPMLGRSRKAFVDELERAEKLGVEYLVFHPGAHLGSGPPAGLETIVESLDWAFAKTPGFRVRALLENSAGQGTALCGTFEELQFVLSHLKEPGRAGVTLDTCHLFANGVDFRSEEGYSAFKEKLSATIGLGSVRAFHLNDAQAGLGSHLDRHANIGEGEIGAEGFRRLVNDPAWAEIAAYLETPLDDDGYSAYRRDLATLRELLPRQPTRPDSKATEHPPRPNRKRAPVGDS